jgi:mannitol/fructose-specific phosphotransferase system IIA component (Ntr-type)
VQDAHAPDASRSVELYIPDLAARTREEALRELVQAAAEAGAVSTPAQALRILRDREVLGSTAIGKGVAIPHARSIGVASPWAAFANSRRGISWEALDGGDVHLVFLLLAPDAPRWRKDYLQHLARLAQVAALAKNRRRLLLARDLAAVRAILAG